ncbi:hypothetical protein F4779DRAFT_639194 [Xylariaceae sp. FL0662B]|nr:hypothetical protein F4779DRAFT_639194 [Xylariaceae sp. FL0662B]
MAPERQFKYYSFFKELYDNDRDIQYIEGKTISRVFNAANSRFYSKAKRENLGNANEFAKEKREDGSTLLEAMAQLAWEWQNDHPRQIPPPGCIQMLWHTYNIAFNRSFFEFGLDEEEGYKPENLRANGFYHDQFDWVRKAN